MNEKLGEENNQEKRGLFTSLKEKKLEISTFIVTLILTLIGFLFSVGNDYFSQYDYEWGTIMSPEKNVNFDDIKAESDKEDPQYYFILDVSGSIKEPKEEKLTEAIREQINKIKSSGHCSAKGFDFDVKENSKTIKYSRLLQVQLLYALTKLYDNKKEKLSVILFSDNPEIRPYDKISETFDLVYEQKFNGESSNFISLIDCLRNSILKDISPSDNYKRRECHLIFFSDYRHDIKKVDSDFELRKKIKEFQKVLNDKSFDIKLHRLEGNVRSDASFLIHLLNLPSTKKIEVLDLDMGIISPLISKKPIPFYYKNSLFEEELTTQILFNYPKKKKLSFGLNSSHDYDNLKQEYYIIHNNDTIHLSTYLHDIDIVPNGGMTLMIKGYIPAPYKSPDIVVQDPTEGLSYVVPVAFYKELPKTVLFFFWAIIVVILGIIIGLAVIAIIRYRNKK